ncbi:amino acid ABC transporter permease [Desulfosediminicola ganghwensis]|uniref:amino acid ABC transporter permease n=1 Tax=Desulfosediminicola ganghwensis TaxID=2569540 RepID=UPI0010AB991D
MSYQTKSTKHWWNNAQHRALLFQVLLIGGLALVVWTIAGNTMTNLEKRGISTGFKFLTQESGFGIIQSLVPYDESYSFGRTFVVGLLNTLLVSFCGIILATILGFTVGVARLSKNWLVSTMAGIYIEIFRNIPLLLQIFFCYFAVLRALPSPKQSMSLGETIFLNIRGLYLPKPIFESGFGLVLVVLAIAVAVTIALAIWAGKRQRETGQQFNTPLAAGLLVILLPLATYFLAGSPVSWELPALKGFNFKGGISIIPEFTALLVALSIYTGAFIAEAVRSGILAVNKGQTEAASALGLHQSMVLKLVVVPQALRVIIPQLTSQYLNLVKNSSLATAIGYPDLVSVFAGTTLNQTGQAIEVVAMTMAVYLFISLTISFLMNWYNKKIMLVER